MASTLSPTAPSSQAARVRAKGERMAFFESVREPLGGAWCRGAPHKGVPQVCPQIVENRWMPPRNCSTLCFYDAFQTGVLPLASLPRSLNPSIFIHTMQKTSSAFSMRSLVSFAAFTALMGCSAAMAQPASGNGRGGPPAEALTACKSAKSGDTCSFSSPNGTLSGTCSAPEGRPLACAPANGGKPGQAVTK